MTDVGLQRALCTGHDLDAAQPAAPEWVHLVPVGRVTGRDGRHFTIRDPHGVVRRSLQGARELPIDYEHEMDAPRPAGGGPVPAAGWIKELDVRADGIWGRVSWTDRAASMIAAREYRFLSPVLWSQKDGTVNRLGGAGLVHRPNLELKSLSSEELPMTDKTSTHSESMAAIAGALGLHAEASTGEIVAAIKNGTAPDPARFIPIDAVKELLEAGKERIVAMSEDGTRRKVDEATEQGYITPGMRDWAMSLCSQDPERFEEFLSCSVPNYAHLSRRETHGTCHSAPSTPANSDAAEIFKHMGVDPANLAD